MSAANASTPSATAEFWRGARLGVPVVLVSAPFAILFGALAVKNGFSPAETMLMSAAIFGGASQMVGIELFGQKIAPWLVVLSIFAVNFRHVLYSAAVGRQIGHWSRTQKIVGFFFLVDPQYAEAERELESGRRIGFAWYMGSAASLYVFWVGLSWVGAAFGSLIPDTHALGLDFLLPIYFLGLVMDFRKRPLWLPVVVVSAIAAVVAQKFVGSPWHVSIGALAGVALAASMPVTPEARADYDQPRPDESGESV